MNEKTEKRPTVTVNCAVPNGLTIALHQVHEGFMGQQIRALQGDVVTLKHGPNEGVDKAWFEAWLEENPNLSVVANGMVFAVDGKPGEEQDRQDPPERPDPAA